MHDFDDGPTTVDLSVQLVSASPQHLAQVEPEEPGTPPAYASIVINDPGVLCRGERLLSCLL